MGQVKIIQQWQSSRIIDERAKSALLGNGSICSLSYARYIRDRYQIIGDEQAISDIANNVFVIDMDSY